MAAFDVPFVNVILHQPGQQAQQPIPFVMVNQKLRLKGLEEALGLQQIRIIVAGHPQGIVLTADNDGFADIRPLKPGSSIEVCGVPVPGNPPAGVAQAGAIASAGAVVVTGDQFSAFANQVVEGVRTALTSGLFDQFAKQLEAGIKPVADGVGILLNRHEVLVITPSNASSTTMKQLLDRIPLPLMRGLMFPVPTAADPPHIEDFNWVVREIGKQDEVSSYDAAAIWINKHLCPPGVKAVFKHQCDWLKGHPAENVEIKNGNVDLVFVLEEYVDAVTAADDLAAHLISICGLCELKTTQTLQSKSSACFAQAAIEHVAANHLQRNCLAVLAELHHVELQGQVKFTTILTDLKALWKVISTTSTHMAVMENTPGVPPKQPYTQLSPEGYSRAAAVMCIQTALAEAAASLISLRNKLFPALAPGAPDVDPGAGDLSGGNGSKDNTPGSRDGQPPGDERASKQLRLSGSSGAGRGSHCLDHSRQAVLQAGAEFKQRVLHDSDLQRDLEAGFSASMVEFLRTPSGYKGLLGLDSPPSTIQLPSFLELLSQPKQEHAAMVIAAVAGARSGDDVSSTVDQA